MIPSQEMFLVAEPDLLRLMLDAQRAEVDEILRDLNEEGARRR